MRKLTSPCKDHGLVGMGLGYATARICIDGKIQTTTLHRKVHYMHTGEWPEVVRHICNNPRCINPEHLIGGTQKDNMQDCISQGRQGDHRNFGAANGRTKLSQQAVEEIRATYIKNSKEFGIPALAKRYGVGTSQIWRVIKHVHHT